MENTIRWRYVKDEDGNPVKKESGEMVKQSNTNVITWSDGSQSLVVGDQVVQVCCDFVTWRCAVTGAVTLCGGQYEYVGMTVSL